MWSKEKGREITKMIYTLVIEAQRDGSSPIKGNSQEKLSDFLTRPMGMDTPPTPLLAPQSPTNTPMESRTLGIDIAIATDYYSMSEMEERYSNLSGTNFRSTARESGNPRHEGIEAGQGPEVAQNVAPEPRDEAHTEMPHRSQHGGWRPERRLWPPERRLWAKKR